MAVAFFVLPLFTSAQIAATDDYAHATMNVVSKTLNVLSNDNDTLGLLKIDNLPLVNHGKATISANKKQILFTPDKDFIGIASINYTITDNVGHHACGLVTIHVSEPLLPATQTIKLYTRPGEKIIFTVPQGCEFSHAEPTPTGETGWGVNGRGSSSDGVYVFTPNTLNYVSGTFIFKRTDNGLEKYYNVFVDVVGTALPQLLKDDYVYIPVNGSKLIDLYANDILSKPIRSVAIRPIGLNPNYEIHDFQDGRVLINTHGLFKGTFNFDYDVTYFDETVETATVHTTIANFEPTAEVFEVTAYHGVPYEFKYNIPLDNTNNAWTFLPKSSGRGAMVLNSKNEIVYTPPTDGQTDYFIARYCVAGAGCKDVKVNVTLKESTNAICSTDCVFPGDANRDGIVDMWDLMAVGSHIGLYGASRANNNVSWTPTSVTNWSQSLESGVNIKNIDLNGDGIISHLDTSVISANFGKINSIVAEKAPEDSKIELQIQTVSNASLGDMIEITVLAGSTTLPVVDAHGLSFSVGYDTDLIEENSLTINFLKYSWLSRFDAYLAMSKLVNRGRIEVGIARSQNKGVSGQGEVVKIRAIVIDEPWGFHLGDKPVLRFRINDVYLMDKQGRKVHIEGKEIAIPLKIAKKDAPMAETDLLMFPNPSSDFMSFYLNGVNNIESLRVVDMMGKEVSRQNNIKGKQATVYFDNLTTGMYIAEVTTEKGKIIKKMQVVK
jgi:Secretion system C-terminal sorting domain/Bacterial Ig domain/Dockerin type I domain